MEQDVKAPGLKWMARKSGRAPYWVAPPAAVKAGYRPKTVPLAGVADNPAALIERCHRLQGELNAWLSPAVNDINAAFDGTIASLLRLYETHPESGFRRVQPATRELYGTYLPVLYETIGRVRVASVTGLDLRRWFAIWRGDGQGHEYAARARVVLAVFRAAVTFGVICGLDPCLRLGEVLRNMRHEFPRPKPRKLVVGADAVVRVREAAREAGRPSLALCVALQFETTLRQWDVIGKWVPISERTPSAVVAGGHKWTGPTWAAIDDTLVLRVTPGKTEGKTGVEVAFDLNLCPMVMEELALIPPEARRGPLIVDERTGLPYRYDAFNYNWRKLRAAAGLPDRVWNRDLRPSGITEGRKAGAATDDLAKGAGHSSSAITARVYDRDVLEAQRRAATARARFRKGE